MKSARLVRPFHFVVDDAPPPEPGPDEVLVRVEGCGVCGSNLPPWRGSEGTCFPLEPGAPGHEAWGRVEACGEGVDGLLGQRVAMLSHRGFAELDVVARDRLVPLPAELDGADVPAEPLACAVNVARRAAVQPGDEVVVLGIGFLGALLLSLLRDARPGRIVAVSRRRAARDLAARMGADEVLSYEEATAWAGRHEDGTADVVIESMGAQRPLEVATWLCRIRGRLIVAGYHQDGPRSVDMRLWNWRGIDVINAHERSPQTYVEGMREGLQRLADGRLDLEPLITHRMPLADIQRAFEIADRRDGGFLKAVVLP